MESMKSDELLEMALGGARTNFERHGHVCPVAMMLLRKNPETGERFKEVQPVMMPILMRDDEEKDFYAEAMKKIAYLGDALAFAFVNEAWVLELQGPKGEAEKHMKKWHGRYSEHPDAREVVQVIFETAGRNEMHRAFITRTPDGANLEPFEALPYAAVEGRFVGFLPPSPIQA